MGTLAAGIKEIFATAKTTGSNVMLCGNDGTPDGHMTMANLASVLGRLNGSFKGNFGGDGWIKIVDLTNGMGAMLINSVSFANQSPTTFSLSYSNYDGSYFISPKLVSGLWNKNDDNSYIFDIRYKYESGRLMVWIKDHGQGDANISYCGVAPSWVHESLPADTIHPSVDDVDLLSFNGIAQNTSNLTRLSNALGGLMFIGNREDANVIGTYFSTTGSMNNKHFPSDGSYWTLISIGDADIALCYQIAFSPSGNIFFRTYWNGWKSWSAIA